MKVSQNQLASGIEIDAREDSFVKVQLILGPTATENTVLVTPVGDDLLPFGMMVRRVDSVEAFEHPFAFVHSGRPTKVMSRSVNMELTA